MKKLISRLSHGIFAVCFFLLLALVVASGSGRSVNYAANISGATSLKAFHFESKYDDLNQNLLVRECSTMDEVSLYGSLSPVSFVGQMTAYGSDCKGCGGSVSCPPRQDVRGGNIYYEDATYGTVRILAADKRIPCGSIIEIKNVTFSSDVIYGIVLDRGGAIVENIIDFLVVSEADSYTIGRQRNVNFTIVRWGW